MKKRIVSFLLALVMAVSLLPVSAFAVDGAYHVAKDATVQQGEDANIIAVQAATEPEQVNGVYQIKTADELVWFQKQVAGGKNSINAALVADIDLSSVCSAELGKNWTPIPVYAGMFDGNGHVITNLYINGATVAKQALFAELSAAGTVKNLGIKNSSVTMTTAKKVNNARAALLVGYNNGGAILEKYYVEATHPAIISREQFNSAQKLLGERNERPAMKANTKIYHPVMCCPCGSVLRKKMVNGTLYLACKRHEADKTACPITQIPEVQVQQAFLRLYYNLKHQGSHILPDLITNLQSIRERKFLWSVDVIELNKQIRSWRTRRGRWPTSSRMRVSPALRPRSGRTSCG